MLLSQFLLTSGFKRVLPLIQIFNFQVCNSKYLNYSICIPIQESKFTSVSTAYIYMICCCFLLLLLFSLNFSWKWAECFSTSHQSLKNNARIITSMRTKVKGEQTNAQRYFVRHCRYRSRKKQNKTTTKHWKEGKWHCPQRRIRRYKCYTLDRRSRRLLCIR